MSCTTEINILILFTSILISTVITIVIYKYILKKSREENSWWATRNENNVSNLAIKLFLGLLGVFTAIIAIALSFIMCGF